MHVNIATLSDKVVFTKSRFGKPVLTLGNYRYNKRPYSTGDKARWVCTRVGDGCKATVTTKCDQIIKISYNHGH